MSTASKKVLAVIPARYASTRFPGKPLADIHGKPMIYHVVNTVSGVEGVDAIVVATDDDRIKSAVEDFLPEFDGAPPVSVEMTSPDHPSGTDRIWEVASQRPEYDLVLNVQGDEPFIDAAMVSQLIQAMKLQPKADIYTAVTPIDGDVLEKQAMLDNPNVVKAVLTSEHQALYFSRAAVPYHRDADSHQAYYRHLGIYLYRRAILKGFTQLSPSPLEECEKLEQLRALEAGWRIYALLTNKAPVGVDTPEDLEALV